MNHRVMMDRERQQQRQAEHEAAGLGEAPSFADVMGRIATAQARDRVREIVAAGRAETEQLEALGFVGRGGFMGTGTYVGADRAPGYRRR